MIQLDENFDLQAVRERLRRMDDAALLRWGQAAARLSSQREIFRLQAEAAREEWRPGAGARTSRAPNDGGPYKLGVGQAPSRVSGNPRLKGCALPLFLFRDIQTSGNR